MTSTGLAIRPEQTTFTEVQRAALRQLGIEDASDADVMVFFHHCQRTGLDPFLKQVHMVARKTMVKVYDERTSKQVERWVNKWTIQTGIDGYRVMGERLAAERDDDVEVEDPMWCGKDGVWHDVWLDETHPPVAAKCTIIKNGKRRTAIAKYAEYVQTVKIDGKYVPNSMWSKMPSNQIGKCSEAAAWRKAYPQDFSGLILEDAAHTVIDGEVEPEKPRRRAGGNAGLRDAVGMDAPVDESAAPEPEVVQPEEPPQVDPDPVVDEPEQSTERRATQAQLKHLHTLMTKEGLTESRTRLDWLETQFERPFTSSAELTTREASQLIDFLKKAQAEDARKAKS